MPARVGFSCSMSQNTGAWASAARTADCADTSTYCPRPVIPRWIRAVMAPKAASAPAHEGACGRVTRIGSPPGSPHSDMAPLIAMISRSEARRSRYGACWPKGEIDTMMRPGLSARRRSKSSPRRARYPGAKLSITKSAFRTIARSVSRPASLSRSSVMLRLLAFNAAQRRLILPPSTVSTNGVHCRSGSPPGGSTLMTSAPRSARMRPVRNPRASVRSTTRYGDKNIIESRRRGKGRTHPARAASPIARAGSQVRPTGRSGPALRPSPTSAPSCA